MLKDDSGDLTHVKLDPSLVNSQNAIIVLDEYNDTCWVWIGRDVKMPTRMHALRMSKSVQKSGYSLGVTTIGMATSKMVEMMEKDNSDPDVATNIATFMQIMNQKWKFDDGVLAYNADQAKQYEAAPPEIRDTGAHTPEKKAPAPAPSHAPARPVQPPPKAPVTQHREYTEVPTVGSMSISKAEKKSAFLLWSTVKNSDLVYVERFERDGRIGMKIEAPGMMVLEVLIGDSDITFNPEDFGSEEGAKTIKTEYETWLGRL
jgi:hypothetical protein